MLVSRLIILRIGNVPNKFVEKIKTRILCSINLYIYVSISLNYS
jgi:hypothetical protein